MRGARLYPGTLNPADKRRRTLLEELTKYSHSGHHELYADETNGSANLGIKPKWKTVTTPNSIYILCDSLSMSARVRYTQLLAQTKKSDSRRPSSNTRTPPYPCSSSVEQ